jgi:hypothetical protein
LALRVATTVIRLRSVEIKDKKLARSSIITHDDDG